MSRKCWKRASYASLSVSLALEFSVIFQDQKDNQWVLFMRLSFPSNIQSKIFPFKKTWQSEKLIRSQKYPKEKKLIPEGKKKRKACRDFPGGSVAKTPLIQCRVHGFNTSWGTKIPHVTQHSQKKGKNNNNIAMCLCMCAWGWWWAQSSTTLCDLMACNTPGSSVHGIFQVRILEWVAFSYATGSSQPRDWTRVSCNGMRILYH